MIKIVALILVVLLIPVLFIFLLFAQGFFKGYHKINND